MAPRHSKQRFALNGRRESRRTPGKLLQCAIVSAVDALATYRARTEHWQTVAAQNERRFIAIGNIRLAILIAGLAMAWLAFGAKTLHPWWLAAPVTAFLILARFLSDAERAREMARRALAHFDHALARMEDRWAGTGATGEGLADAHHVYADDIDLFGRGSLFQLLCTARTTTGEQTLARWLLAPADRNEAQARQAALRELSPRVDLREELALLGEDARTGVRSEALAEWGSEQHVEFPAIASAVAIALATVNAIALIGYFATWWDGLPVILALMPALLFEFWVRQSTQQALRRVRSSARDLEILSLIFARLERERFQSAKLSGLCSQLQAEGAPVSQRIARLARLVVWIDSCNHIIMAVLSLFLVLRPQLAMAVERWRKANGPHIRQWIAVMGEIEALNSLAAFTFEHSEASFPEFLNEADGPQFSAKGLLHPLLPRKTSVENDVTLGGELRLLIVSGSNMSGKSTLLRAIGLNCVLAWAGAPVTAQSLGISPVALGASLRTVDSLQEGRSRFYAEILRLSQIMDLATGTRPVLFLLDELLSGTNSHDRRIGATGVVTDLLERGAIGLITTHDLALTQIADSLGARAANCHFEDHLEEGKISFDYKLRPGVVQRSNALELMRAVGLKV